MKTKYILVILIGAVITSCGRKNTVKAKPDEKDPFEKIKTLDWFIGTWENRSPEGIMTESWTVLNDSVFTGTSFYMEGGDTLFSEQITIEQRGANLFYIPVIKDQNAGKPTLFKLTSQKSYPVNGERAVFENQEHDFPQKISYELKGDSLLAEISGKLEGKDHSERFPMVKAK